MSLKDRRQEPFQTVTPPFVITFRHKIPTLDELYLTLRKIAVGKLYVADFAKQYRYLAFILVIVT